VKLWRRCGLEVTLLPTWKADANWQKRLERIGCRTVECRPERLGEVPGLAGGLVVSMCNRHFLAAAEKFRAIRCRIVWLGCMNWLLPEERLHYRRFSPFERYVFQSRYQRAQLEPQLGRFGYEPSQGRVIRGAFDLAELPFRPLPHGAGEVFTIGRISRAASDKFSANTWNIYGRTPYPVRARVLGYDPEVEARLGEPPHWAECLAPGSRSAAELLPTLHAMVHAGGTVVENWPRAGLEAMAAGVPLVVDRRGGWCEMICHGQTGLLCEDDHDFAYYTAQLARDEPFRLRIAHQARSALEEELAEPERFRSQWQTLLGGV
jgi:hypothetical protein